MRNLKICKSCSYYKKGNCINPKVRNVFGQVNNICTIGEDWGCTLWSVNSRKFYANGIAIKENGMSSAQAQKYLNGIPTQEKPKKTAKGSPRLVIYKEKE